MRIILVPNFQVEYSIQLANALAVGAGVSFPCWDALAPQLVPLLDERGGFLALGAPGRASWPRLWDEIHLLCTLSSQCCDVGHFLNAASWRAPVVPRLT